MICIASMCHNGLPLSFDRTGEFDKSPTRSHWNLDKYNVCKNRILFQKRSTWTFTTTGLHRLAFQFRSIGRAHLGTKCQFTKWNFRIADCTSMTSRQCWWNWQQYSLQLQRARVLILQYETNICLNMSSYAKITHKAASVYQVVRYDICYWTGSWEYIYIYSYIYLHISPNDKKEQKIRIRTVGFYLPLILLQIKWSVVRFLYFLIMSLWDLHMGHRCWNGSSQALQSKYGEHT